MPKQVRQSPVYKLLKAGINYKDYKSLVNYLGSETRTPGWDFLLMGHSTLKERYWRAWAELNRELVPNRASPEDLYNKLWNLFKEVVPHKAIFQSEANLRQKVDDFLKEVRKPLIDFDVIYEIRNLNVGEQHFALGNVEIFKLTSDYLREHLPKLGKTRFTTLTEASIVGEWVGRSVAKVEVSASEPDRASHSAEIEINNVLNILRLAVRKQLISTFTEDIFLWELGETIVTPKIRPQTGPIVTVGAGRAVGPLIVDLGESISKGLEDLSTWEYLLDSKLPEDIYARLMRAVEWVSHSITGRSLDYKLVDLCTALEILLLAGHEKGGKGALIALRQVLLGQSEYCHPAGILGLYQKRNQVIHGGHLNITGYHDYWHLLICCIMVLEDVVHLSQKHPHIHEMKTLYTIAENKETLGHFIRMCERGLYGRAGIGDIKKAAENLLKQHHSNSVG